MAYEQTNQDGLYIEDSYFTPDGYFVYVAEAASALSVTGNLSADVSVIKNADCSMSVTSSVSATISHIEGADLFAFSDAQLAVSVDRIRDNNLAASTSFSVAIDAVRGVYVSAQADSVASINVDYLRSREFEAANTAAFSMSAQGQLIKETSAVLSSSASTTISVSSNIGIIAALSSSATQTTAAVKSIVAAAALSSQASIRICGGVRYERPLVAESLNNVLINNSTKKFGDGSLQIQTNSGYINYYATKDLVAQGNPAGTGDEFLLEFWFYSTSTRANRTLFDYTNSAGTQQYWSFGFNSSGYLQFVISGPSVNAFYTSSTTLSSDQWNHIAVSFSTGFGAGGISIWLNGTRIHNSSTVAIPPIPPDLGLLRIGNRATTGLVGYIDDLRVVTAYHGSNTLINIGRSPSSTTITVPTTRLYNDDAYTRFLGHFDLDYCDDVSDIELAQALVAGQFTLSADVRKFGVVTAAAALTSTSTVAATGLKIHPGQADFTAVASVVTAIGRIRPFVDASAGEFSLAADAVVIKSADSNVSVAFSQSVSVTKTLGPITADLASQAQVTVDVNYTQGAVSNLNVQGFLVTAFGRIRPFVDVSAGQFTLSADGTVTSQASGQFTAAFTETVDVTKTLGAITALLTSAFTESVQANVIPSGSTSMSASFTESATPNRLRNYPADFAATTSLIAQAQTVIVGASTLSAQFTESATALRIKSLDSNLPSIATELVAINKVGRTLVDMSVVSTMTTAAVSKPSGSVEMPVEAAMSTTVLRIKSTSVALTAVATTTVSVTTNKDIRANLVSRAVTQIAVIKTARAGANMPSPAFGLTANAGTVKKGIALVASGGTMTIRPTAVKRIQKNLAAVSTVAVTSGRNARAQATLQVQAFTLISGRELRLDPDLTYVIPKEYRSYKIRRETRGYLIPYESRQTKIRGN